MNEIKLGNTIYEGNSSVVRAAQRSTDGAPVVVKLLRDSRADPQEEAQLQHEYAILRDLHVDGVVKALGLERFDGHLGLVLEDLGRQSLGNLLRRGALGIRQVLAIGIAVGAALGTLHRQGVIHRDVKPQNIIVGESERVTLIDFGAATRQLPRLPPLIPPFEWQGSFAYVSPEQTGRTGRSVDRRADLYSLGVTLYEIITGKLPFIETDALALVHAHLARKVTPPSELRPEVPATLSAILLKLLAKDPEDRYQTGEGLVADLVRCERELRELGAISSWPLGADDIVGELQAPRTLHGRVAEIAEVLASIDCVTSRGGGELVLLAGHAGTGKSSIANEIREAVAFRAGYFLSGKCDQLNRGVPFAPVVAALREAARILLTEPENVLELWRQNMSHAVGAGGRVLTGLIPELQPLVQSSLTLPPLGPRETQNVLGMAVQAFLRTLCESGKPVVLFFDDLQWADTASLRLLVTILTDPEIPRLFALCAYRDNEVDAAHPLDLALKELQRSGTSTRTIELGPLGPRDVCRAVAEMIQADEASSADLAAIAFEKTQGNPFFLLQFIAKLHEDNLLCFDKDQRKFVWDEQRIREASVTDNVVDFMVAVLERLSPRTQRVLRLSACVGHEFDLAMLALIADAPEAEVLLDLGEALGRGLLLPAQISGELPQGANGARYRFLHDRVQQAAYLLIADADRQRIHLMIGRQLRPRADAEHPSDVLFAAVHHLEAGVAGITSADERLDFARLCLAAGKKAKHGAALEAAAGYFRAAVAIAECHEWQDPALAFALHIELAECAYLLGQMDEGEALIDKVLARESSRLNKGQAYNLRIVAYCVAGRYASATEVGCTALTLLGVDWPDASAEREGALREALAEVDQALGGRKIEALIDAPPMASPEFRLAATILANLFSPVYIHDRSFSMLLGFKHAALSLRYGHSAACPRGYNNLGLLLTGSFGRHEEAFQYGKLAIALDERLSAGANTCKIYELFGAYIHLSRPLGIALPYLERAIQAGLEMGEFAYLSYACVHTTSTKLSMGRELSDLQEEIDRYLVLTRRAKNAMGVRFVSIARQFVANLRGHTLSRATLSDGSFDEEAFALELGEAGTTWVEAYLGAQKLMLACLHQEYASAISLLPGLIQRLPSAAGFYWANAVSLYICVSLAESPGAAGPEHDALFTHHRNALAGWAAHCPENYASKYLLVLAEEARLQEKPLQAMELFDQAIAVARKEGLVCDEALGHELAARLYRSLGRERCARAYLADAAAAYKRWGATAKVADIGMSGPEIQNERSLSSWAETTNLNPSTLLDVTTVIRATQAISATLDIHEVLEQCMRILLANAGAERGFLLRDHGGKLNIIASIQVAPDQVRTGLSELPRDEDLAMSVVHYVARMRKPVVLGEAFRDPHFSADPFIRNRRLRSILCVPLVYQGRLAAIAYLENNAASAVFTPARADICSLLATQAASAIENAALYERLKDMSETLEEQVRKRTEQLRTTQAQLVEELSERERAVHEQAALQERIIQAQAERLTELSAPMVPITRHIVAMPLVGRMDHARAEHVRRTVVEEAHTCGVRIVILDLTGVKGLDRSATVALLRASAALRCIGVETVMTGVGAAMARNLVDTGEALGGIAVRATLEHGIAYAMGKLSRGARE